MAQKVTRSLSFYFIGQSKRRKGIYFSIELENILIKLLSTAIEEVVRGAISAPQITETQSVMFVGKR